MDIKRLLKNNWLLILALLYLIFPLDIIPDAVPVVGTLDDALILFVELLTRLKASKKEGSVDGFNGDVVEGEVVE